MGKVYQEQIRFVDTKICTGCLEEKGVVCFNKSYNSPDWKTSKCKSCLYIRNNQINAENRQKILDQYGAVCGWCGNDDFRVLQLDHINQDGYLHRAEIGENKIKLTKAVLANPERFQLLCANCHCIKSWQAKQELVNV